MGLVQSEAYFKTEYDYTSMQRYALAYLLSAHNFHVNSQLFLEYMNKDQLLTANVFHSIFLKFSN